MSTFFCHARGPEWAVLVRAIVVAIAAVTGMALISAAADDAGDEDAIKFINLTIPAPWDIKKPTHVLHATKESVIVAQRAYLKDRADIRVVEIKGNEARFVGENGRGITGVDLSRLHAAARSPDGRLWIVAEYSRFPNQIAGNQFCLFVLENDRWSAVGPRFGAPVKDTLSHDDRGLYFFGDNRPLTVSIDARIDGEQSKWHTRLRRLEGERWLSVPGTEYVSDRNSSRSFHWRASDAWLIGSHEKEGRTVLDARWMKGPRREDVARPYKLDSWPGKMCFFHFAVSPDGSIAAVGCHGSIEDIKPNTPFFVKCYRPAGDGTYKLEESPLPPGTGHAIDAVAYSPTGVLHAVRSADDGDSDKVVVYALAGGAWSAVGEGGMRREFGSRIMDASLFFRDDGRPIVTWEKFVQVD